MPRHTQSNETRRKAIRKTVMI
uniref:Uncharacterized protein n=1 Tax=Arundo donax TaxID=35708 RepID=A0A0A9FE90_ARUDO